MYDNNYMNIEERAREVAAELLGTCDDLMTHATEEETENTEFCAVLDGLVYLCEQCGWWVEAGEINDNGECSECQPS